jgi:hypothetical protein
MFVGGLVCGIILAGILAIVRNKIKNKKNKPRFEHGNGGKKGGFKDVKKS